MRGKEEIGGREEDNPPSPIRHLGLKTTIFI